MASEELKLHLYTDEENGDFIAAATLQEAQRIARDDLDYTPEQCEAMALVEDTEIFTLELDANGEIVEEGDTGTPFSGTAAEWAEKLGKGFQFARG